MRRPGTMPGLASGNVVWLDLDQRHLRHRAAARRAAVAAVVRRLGLAGARLARLRRGRDLLRLGRDRAFDVFEPDLVLARLVLDDHDADMAAALELAKQYFV